MAAVIEVEHVYKSYSLNPRLEMKHLVQRILRTEAESRSKAHARHVYVLQDVSFRMNAGDSLGVAGNNGAGKTTLCRLLASITLPTRGRIRVVGRVSSLIALGAGFHPELSGLENVRLNCALMGLSKKQTASRVEQIVEFSELEEHIEMAVKRYSSGMLARLGFSVAVHLDPEIILVDEVLAVGDYRFQIKSLTALEEFMRRGTVMFISHDLRALQRLCKRTLWLDDGQVVEDGPSSQVIPRYIAAQQRTIDEAKDVRPAEPAPTVARDVWDESLSVEDVQVLDGDGQPRTEFRVGETIVVRCRLAASKPTPNIHVAVGFIDPDSKAVVTVVDNQLLDQPEAFSGNTIIECRFPQTFLRPRGYGVFVGLGNDKALMPLYAWRDLEKRFTITGELRDAEHHYLVGHPDLVYTPGVEMRYLEVNLPL
jgi:ABC-type polysaccharide/polyol phosphate transport system ATPase subunit